MGVARSQPGILVDNLEGEKLRVQEVLVGDKDPMEEGNLLGSQVHLGMKEHPGEGREQSYTKDKTFLCS